MLHEGYGLIKTVVTIIKIINTEVKSMVMEWACDACFCVLWGSKGISQSDKAILMYSFVYPRNNWPILVFKAGLSKLRVTVPMSPTTSLNQACEDIRSRVKNK